jgi:hypothetical protein
MELGRSQTKRTHFLRRARPVWQSLNADICGCFTLLQDCPFMKAA